MTSLKRPQRNIPAAPVKPGPAPSASLLTQFTQEADRKRVEAGDSKVTASAAAEAAKVAQADAEQYGDQLTALLAEVERARALFDEKVAEADHHRARAMQHEARAAELLNDAAYLDEVAARATTAPPQTPTQPACSCTIPGAPDAAERAAACPIHGHGPADRDDGDGGEGAVR